MHDELILHHYPRSPFAEKARLMLGFKGLAWRSVTIPMAMPKPDVIALTGGYRRTPLLQVGADVYCDTALIARVLERRNPEPTLFPAAAPLAPLLAQWADFTLFWAVIGYAMRPEVAAAIFGGDVAALKAFAADRAAFTAGMKRATPVDAAVQLQAYLGALESQLDDGRPFLFGADASIADFSVAHCLWYLHGIAQVAGVLEPYRSLGGWLQRMLGIGHGRHEPLDSADAVKLAAGATSHAAVDVAPGLGFEAGERVTVAATDYGSDPVAGALVGLDAGTVVLRRVDERAGTVHVHFPRIGFQIRKESPA